MNNPSRPISHPQNDPTIIKHPDPGEHTRHFQTFSYCISTDTNWMNSPTSALYLNFFSGIGWINDVIPIKRQNLGEQPLPPLEFKIWWINAPPPHIPSKAMPTDLGEQPLHSLKGSPSNTEYEPKLREGGGIPPSPHQESSSLWMRGSHSHLNSRINELLGGLSAREACAPIFSTHPHFQRLPNRKLITLPNYQTI